jgi:hypothetical protein
MAEVGRTPRSARNPLVPLSSTNLLCRFRLTHSAVSANLLRRFGLL